MQACKVLRNVGILPHHYMVPQPRRLRLVSQAAYHQGVESNSQQLQYAFKMKIYIYASWHKLTNSKEQSPSWETNNHSVSQEISRLSLKQKVHYCVHNRPTMVPIFSHTRTGHTFPSYSSKIYSTFSSHLRLFLPSSLFPSVFLTKILYEFLTSSMRATCPAHEILNFITLVTFDQALKLWSSSDFRLRNRNLVTWMDDNKT
jgi:hypothetical protein